jgi:hypothetical protein
LSDNTKYNDTTDFRTFNLTHFNKSLVECSHPIPNAPYTGLYYIVDCYNTIASSVIISQNLYAPPDVALHISEVSIYSTDACASDPCKTNKTGMNCINNIDSYQCLCPNGNLTNPNQSNCSLCINSKTIDSMCFNNGVCSIIYGNTSTPTIPTNYKCDCGLTYGGRNCERFLDRFSCTGWPFGVYTSKPCDANIVMPPQTECDCCCSTGECICK